MYEMEEEKIGPISNCFSSHSSGALGDAAELTEVRSVMICF